MAECSAELIELGNAIKGELGDESAAAHKYADMAAKFTHLNEPQNANILRLLSSHEQLHKTVLEAIVDQIATKCRWEQKELADLKAMREASRIKG